ncbi:acyl-CoA dehydrogenase family protein, partial [Burkholderia sp.]
APSVTTSGLVKRTVTEHAIRVVEQALKLSGNHGLSRANPLERHYRDVLCSRVHTPQDDAIAVAAGRAALDAASAGETKAKAGEASRNAVERGRHDA